MAVQLDLPSAFTGEPDQQLRQVYSYLYQLSEQLTNALNTISADQFVAEDRNVLTNLKDGELPAAADKTIKAQGSTLKSLIVKTADRIEQQMDLLEQNFSSNYVAQSEFGTYKDEVDNKVQTSANGVKTTIEALEVTLSNKIGQTDFS